MARRFDKVAFMASPTPDAQDSLALLKGLYDSVEPDDADVIVALGGDGLMLQTLHRFMGEAKPIYGMNRGTVGFLMNDFKADDLLDRLENAHRSVVHPLKMVAWDTQGQTHAARAINDVYMLRQTHQAAKLCIRVDDHVRLPELVADGGTGCDARRVDGLQPVGRRPESCPSTRPFSPSPRFPPSAPAAGVGPCCRTMPGSRST
jgi:NAD+ kinase